MEAVRTWQRVCFGKGVGKRRDWFFELVPDSVREAEDRVTY
jgi:hypothetical protein